MIDRYNFECLEGNEEKVGDKVVIDHIVNLFPEASRVRKRFGDSGKKMVFTGITLDPASTSEIPCSDSLQDDFFPSHVRIEKGSESLQCTLDSSVRANGNMISKIITFRQDKTWTLEIGNKMIDLKAILISDKYQCSREGVCVVCNIFERFS